MSGLPPTPEMTSSAPSPAPSSWAVVAQVFHAPTRAFEALRQAPRWWLALLILLAASVATQLVVIRHMDMEGTVREQIASSARGRQLSEEQIEQAVQQGAKFAPIGAMMGVVATPVIFLIIAAVYFLGLKVAGSEAEFKPVFATTLHAMLPPAVVGGAVTGLVVAQKGTITGQEVARAVKSNLGAFLSPDAPAALRAAAEVLDIFNLWMGILLAIGLSITGRIPRARAATVVAVVWVGWVGIRVLMATLF